MVCRNALYNVLIMPDIPQTAAETQPVINPTIGLTEPETPPSSEKSEQSRREKRHWLDYLEAGMAGIGLLVLVVYAIATIDYAWITNKMWIEMQEQTRIQRNTAIDSDRAWVGLDVPITLDAIETESTTKVIIKGHYSFKNFGHGPAAKVVQAANFASDPGNLQATSAEADFFCGSSIKFATGGVTAPMGGKLKEFPPFGYTLFPNQPHDESIDYQGNAETVTHLRFIGCVAYIDQFKAVHWTKFCMERRPGDMARIPKLDFCAMYNDTDQPKEK